MLARFDPEAYGLTTAIDREVVEAGHVVADDDTLFVADSGFLPGADRTESVRRDPVQSLPGVAR